MKLSLKDINALRHDTRTVVRELGLLRDAYFHIGVTLAERHLLLELQIAPHADAKEIAEKLFLDKSTASRLIARAVKKGFVRISTDSKDKRRKPLQITEKGLQTLRAFEKLAQKQVQDALIHVKTEDVQIIYQGMKLFAKALQEARLY